MSSDATVSDDNLPARPVLKDAPTVAERQDVDAMPARGSVIPSNARQRAAWPGRARVGGACSGDWFRKRPLRFPCIISNIHVR